MRTISDELKASLERKTPVYKKTVEIYRRLWSSGAFVFDTALDITDQVKEYSPIRWKFDSEAFNVWTLDNTALVFRNDRNQWKQGNTKGYFPSGYQIADSKIVVKFGAQLADGTFEVLKSFTGYINTDPRYDSTGKTATITIYGGMAVFERTPAETISTLVEDELLGTGSGTVFTTANNGVGQTKEFELLRGTSLAAATEIKPSIDYSASDANKPDLPLTVTLVTDLVAGESLWISYRYWHQDKTLEWLAEQVMTLCGVTSYSITKATFTTDVEYYWEQNTQADWETADLDGIDTATSPDDALIAKDFPPAEGNTFSLTEDLAYIENPGNFHRLYNDKYSCGTNYGASGTTAARVASSNVTGTWRIVLNASPGNAAYTHFISDTGVRTTTSGYCVALITDGPYYGYVKFYRVDSGSFVELKSWYGFGYSLDKTANITITRDSDGKFNIWWQGTTETATDATYSASSYYLVVQTWSVSGYSSRAYTCSGQFRGYSYKLANANATGGSYHPYSFMDLPALDCGVDLTRYGQIRTVGVIPSGTDWEFYTYSSSTPDFSSGNDPAGWVETDLSGIPQSTLQRYLKIRWKPYSNTALTSTPTLSQMQFFYYISTTTINLVNLTGMTCKQVLEELAKWPAYEIGMTPDEMFIYRPRSTALPAVMELRSDTNIEKLYNISPGIDRVKNRIVADFGIYRRISDASGDTNPNSIDDYDVREYTVSSSQLLPPENANLAFAVAPSVLAYSKYARRRCQVDTMFLPQLELGDKVTLYYAEDTALRRWKWGDTDVVLGQADLEYYDEENLENRYNFWGVDMRIEGISLDPNTFRTTLDLTEII